MDPPGRLAFGRGCLRSSLPLRACRRLSARNSRPRHRMGLLQAFDWLAHVHTGRDRRLFHLFLRRGSIWWRLSNEGWMTKTFDYDQNEYLLSSETS